MPKRIHFLSILLIFAGVGSAAAAELHTGAQLGYRGGPGGQGYVELSDFAEGLPLSLRLGVEYVSLDPGRALDARSIFINDNTNGTPDESGRVWDYRLDFVLPTPLTFAPDLHLFGGPRYARFTGNFVYVGGNEDFDVISRQWGMGVGAETRHAIGYAALFTVGVGVDWYPDSKLSGHDTSYSPDGETINGRNDYDFDDANEAIDQPSLDFRVQIGLAYRFGG